MFTFFYYYIYFSDPNCIKVLAPDDHNGSNKGAYISDEHIGHLRREWATKLAPIIEKLIDLDMLQFASFDCLLCESDANHSRNGYVLTIVVKSECDDSKSYLEAKRLFLYI